jgi:hypothetical protein
MSDREIDRRVLLCDAQILSAPSAKQTGVFSRIFGKKTAPDLGRSLMADYGGMGRNKPVSLLKCEVLLPPSPLPVEVSPVVSEPIQETPTHSDPTTPTENTKGGKVKKPVPRGAGQSQKSRRSTPAAPPAQPGKNQVVPMEGVKDKLDKRGNQA